MESLSLTEMVYAELRNYIIEGNWPAGTRLKETDLSNIFHVSRTPIRAALMSLSHEGLVNYKPNIGYTVVALNEEIIREIFLIRVALEKMSSVQAMRRMNEEDFDELKEIITCSEKAGEAGDTKAVVEFSTTFNRRISEMANMPRLLKLQSDLSDFLLRLRNISFSGGIDRCKDAAFEHRMIIAAMEEGDEAKVEAVVTEHLVHSCDFILKKYRTVTETQAQES